MRIDFFAVYVFFVFLVIDKNKIYFLIDKEREVLELNIDFLFYKLMKNIKNTAEVRLETAGASFDRGQAHDEVIDGYLKKYGSKLSSSLLPQVDESWTHSFGANPNQPTLDEYPAGSIIVNHGTEDIDPYVTLAIMTEQHDGTFVEIPHEKLPPELQTIIEQVNSTKSEILNADI
jgi:hypothetical protein